MGFSDILVHVSVSRHCPARVALAARLAKAFDAHLTGLYTSAEGDVSYFMMQEIASKLEPTMRAWWQQKRGEARTGFDAALRETGIAADWREVGRDAGAAVPYFARYADLAVVGQADPDEMLPRTEYEVPERVALESGRPVLVVPYAGEFATVPQRVLIAWNGSAQAARAVNDAMPFLTRAAKVKVLTINPEEPAAAVDEEPLALLAAHLSRHGVAAETERLAADDVAAEELILSRAGDYAADMIVMGAYGHARAREMVLGGATRRQFRHMTVPTLMSH